MTTVVGVKFRRSGKLYYFDPGKLELVDGQVVIVETVRGVEAGYVNGGIKQVEDNQVYTPLKPIIRIATEKDKKQLEDNIVKEKEAFAICEEKIAKHGIEMKLVDVEYTFDAGKILFYFTADGRIDFRELVKDLASVFRTRIELRQIGIRDEAKMLGGLGICGRELCCKKFLSDFHPVSIKMAKEQGLSLNPVKISGCCGRLMCCLKYEQDAYEDAIKRMPQVGSIVKTEDGQGTVTKICLIKEMLTVKIENDKGYEPIVNEYHLDDVEIIKKQKIKIEEHVDDNELKSIED